MCPINYICTVFLLARVRNITKVEALRKKKMLLIAVPLIARCSRVKPNSKKFRLNLWEKKNHPIVCVQLLNTLRRPERKISLSIKNQIRQEICQYAAGNILLNGVKWSEGVLYIKLL